ncbi:hypothetical protein, partial [Rossellomorea sp. BNER]|uniref:hypothetical protein n=1 Tax=Rossellomorea sp. BNER TaxID=2962031 RepID=UPI003AF2FEDD|nr:hypothetical protein [Rossellomorea sp. BNER]
MLHFIGRKFEYISRFLYFIGRNLEYIGHSTFYDISALASFGHFYSIDEKLALVRGTSVISVNRSILSVETLN